MNLERLIGSIITDRGPRPFILYVKTGRLEVGTYALPDEAQAGLSVIQQQQFAQLIHELANVSFAHVRLGQLFCSRCGEWKNAAQGEWHDEMCAACARDLGAEPAGRAAEPTHAAPEAAVAARKAAPARTPRASGIERALSGEEAMLEKAISLAAEAHRGQRDKADDPYILHPLRMMLRMQTPAEQMAAVLHDVVEDTRWTLEALRREGFPEEVLDAVAALTRQADESYEAFIERAAQHPLARRVKQADLEDNMDLRRLAVLTEKDQERLARYLRAWRRLRES